MILFCAHSGWLRSSEQLRHLVARRWLLKPMTVDLLPVRPDHEQITKGIGDIKVELLASCTIHFTTSPFQSMSQTKLVSSLYYSPASDMPACLWDTMAPRRHHITTAILDKYVCVTAATVVQGVYACRWRQCWALFDIHVDLELVNIKLIFVLY